MAQTADEIQTVLFDLILEVVPGLPEEDVKPDVSLTNELGLDSVTVVRLAIEVDKSLGKSVPLTVWLAAEGPQGRDTLQAMAAWIAAGAPPPQG
ncbi:MAG: acyl carrier protein [Candidatus Sericytochromatia bacterium]|nr:acyl carrier protein [Candidatus Sericytochromatia bacterium]